MGTNYKIHINMDDNTVNVLYKGGYHLYAFKGVQTSLNNGSPLVWFHTNQFSADNTISWTEHYQAYSSISTIVPNGQIVAAASYDVDLGQIFSIDQETGTGHVMQGDDSTAITIYNTTNKQFATGISQEINNVTSELCVFPHYGQNMNIIKPIQKVLLFFATKPMDTGVVILQSLAPAGLFDLTHAPNNQRTVSYHVNENWNWDNQVWGKQIAAGKELTSLLIEHDVSLKERPRAAISAAR